MSKRAICTNEVRRRDRAVTEEEWIETYLERAEMGTLAFALDGEITVNLNTFVYDRADCALYMHSARTGRTGALLADSGPCAAVFVTGESGRYLPSEHASKFSVEYQSVVLNGELSLLQGDAAREPLYRLLEKYFPHLHKGQDYNPITPEEIYRTAVYRLRVTSWSGKRKAEAEEFPGAFRYGAR